MDVDRGNRHHLSALYSAVDPCIWFYQVFIRGPQAASSAAVQCSYASSVLLPRVKPLVLPW